MSAFAGSNPAGSAMKSMRTQKPFPFDWLDWEIGIFPRWKDDPFEIWPHVFTVENMDNEFAAWYEGLWIGYDISWLWWEIHITKPKRGHVIGIHSNWDTGPNEFRDKRP